MVLATGFIGISLLFKIDQPIYAGLGIMLVTVFSETAGKWIAKTWLKFGEILGNINSKIILSIFFFGILLPVALFKKLLSFRSTDKTPHSNWQSPGEEKIDFTKPW